MHPSDILATVKANEHKIKQLKEATGRLLEELSDASGSPLDEFLTVTNSNTLRITLYGITLTCERRIVSDKQDFVAVEFLFQQQQDENVLTVWKMYVSPGGQVFEDSELNTRLCDYNDGQLIPILVDNISKSLIDSPVFLPTSD